MLLPVMLPVALQCRRGSVPPAWRRPLLPLATAGTEIPLTWDFLTYEDMTATVSPLASLGSKKAEELRGAPAHELSPPEVATFTCLKTIDAAVSAAHFPRRWATPWFSPGAAAPLMASSASRTAPAPR
jgi:hypothetical protein